MAVGIGNFSDPKQLQVSFQQTHSPLILLQGLAHYLEHMLFMGSEKFPTENEYDDYLQQNGGFCNAYTDLVISTYSLCFYFYIRLKRFSYLMSNQQLCMEHWIGFRSSSLHRCVRKIQWIVRSWQWILSFQFQSKMMTGDLTSSFIRL